MKSRCGLSLLKILTKSIYSLEKFQLPEGHFLKDLFSPSVTSDSVTPWTAACQASLSFTISQSLLELMSNLQDLFWWLIRNLSTQCTELVSVTMDKKQNRWPVAIVVLIQKYYLENLAKLQLQAARLNMGRLSSGAENFLPQREVFRN